MKAFQYIYYFFRSLRYRGIKNTFKLISYENKYEKQLGIHTHSIVNLNDLTLAGENSDQNHHYQGASYFILFSMIGKLPENLKNAPFIDFGCGKGRALFVAEQCGFTNLIGVDIAKELIMEAKANASVYRKKNELSHFEFIFQDATTYAIPVDARVFYFFNPFGADILNEVLLHLKQSVKEHPRTIYCLYLNPVYKEVFNKNGFNVFYTEKNKAYLEGIIFKSPEEL